MDPRIKKLAKLLVDYSIKVKKDDYVSISGSPIAADLILAIEERVLKKGAYPIPKIALPGESYIYYKNASREQLKHSPKLMMHEIKNIHARISICDEINTKELSAIDPKKIALREKVMAPIFGRIMDKENKINWCVTLYPTNAYAQEAGMSLPEFEDFVYSALFVDKKDPIGEWKKLSKRQKDLVDIITQGNEVRITGKETDLTMSIKGRKGINCDGHYNLPDGEVFTGPIENSVNGKILFQTYPVIDCGNEIKGIRIKFKNGKVIKATAEKNEKFLHAMLNTDSGAKYVGELGIGSNFGIKRFIKHILFDEKIGGTIHIALGSGFEESGSKNKSAIHWDMIMDLGKEGSLYIDGKKLVRKGDRLVFER